MDCYECGSDMVHRIDGGLPGETDRPYGIYFCPVCKRLFTKFDDEK